MNVKFDYRDIAKFQATTIAIGKVPKKAVTKAAQKGSNVMGSAIRKAAPRGETGQLAKGFRKNKERSSKAGKAVYQYAMDSRKNDIFQKPIQNPGVLGGKSDHAYYPASVEYGFLAKAPGEGFYFRPGHVYATQVEEGQHFERQAAESAGPKAAQVMSKTLNEELDKEWKK